MKKDFVCQQDFDHKIWGIGDLYQKKREMFVETSYLLLSVNIEYRLKQSIPVKIAGCFVSGRTKQKNQLLIFQDLRGIAIGSRKKPSGDPEEGHPDDHRSGQRTGLPDKDQRGDGNQEGRLKDGQMPGFSGGRH